MPGSRKRPASFPLAGLLQLANLPQDQVTLQRTQTPRKKDAVEVIDFVLEGAGEELCALHLEPVAIEVLRFDGDFGRTRDLVANVRQAEAAFFSVLLAFSMNDFRIDENDFIFRSLLVAEVDDGDAPRDADLGRGQADANGLVHRLEHVRGQRAELVVELRDLFRGPLQNRVRIGDDFSDHFQFSLLAASYPLIAFNLIHVTVIVTFQFFQGISAEFFKGEPGYREGDHRFSRDAGRRYHTNIAALVGRFRFFARIEADRLQRAAQRGNRLEVAPNHDVFAVRDAAFDAAGIVLFASKARVHAVLHFLGIADRVVHRGTERLRGGDAAADLDGLDCLARHDRLGQQAIEALIPVSAGAEARRRAMDDDFEDSSNRVAGAQHRVHFPLHALLVVAVHAVEQNFVVRAQGSDLFPGGVAL